MTHLRAAIRFITVLPAGPATGFDAVAMVPWFPVVGLILGGLLAAGDRWPAAGGARTPWRCWTCWCWPG